MDHVEILSLALDMGAAMIESGAETHRVEDSLYRICAAYGFTSCSVWVIPSNIQTTVTAPTGEVLTQIRHVRSMGMDFDTLDRLNDACRRSCADKPDGAVLKRRLREATAPKRIKSIIRWPAALIAGASFGVFFNCNAMDALVAAAASLLVTALDRLFLRRQTNPMILNFLITFITELFILTCVKLGFGQHTGYISVGVAMLLISALGATNGLRDLVHLDTLSGVMNITASFTGALGIALGIAAPILLLPSWSTPDIIGAMPGPAVTLAAATIGCLGFALYLKVLKPKHLFACALGSAITWAVYLLLAPHFPNGFLPTVIGAAACALFSFFAARINRAPATVFQTICIV